MDTKFRNSKMNVLVLAFIVAIVSMPTRLIYAAENTEVYTEEYKITDHTEKEIEEPSRMTAGATSFLEDDYALQDEELVELAKSNTTEAIEVKTLEKSISDIAMANVKEYVNVRAEASQDSAKIGQLYKDCGGHIVERKDGWTKLKSGSLTGWVKDDFLIFGAEAEELAKQVGMLTATSTVQSLRVRKEASTDAPILGVLSENETMEAISQDGDWVQVSYEGETAYVSAEYVKVDFQLDAAESMEEIKAREEKEAEAKRLVQKEAIMTSANEMDILAAIIQCEAGGEPFEGQLAVGAVVLNRVRCGGYPNSIAEVVYASGQFSPANSQKMTNLVLTGNIKESCRLAAQQAAAGISNVGDAMHFRRAGSQQGIVIGNHVFW